MKNHVGILAFFCINGNDGLYLMQKNEEVTKDTFESNLKALMLIYYSPATANSQR